MTKHQLKEENMTELYKLSIKAAIEAGKKILEIYELPEITVEKKSDQSPLTLADVAANTCINKYLIQTDIPIISEENRQLDYHVRQKWDRCWIVDPLDGTKEFIKRNGEFTVNIALCIKGCPIFGVIYAPVARALYYGDVDKGKAYKTVLDDGHAITDGLFMDEDSISPAKAASDLVRVVGSRSHMNQETQDFITSLDKNYDRVEIVSKGSSLKFCLVAEGQADVYPRFAPTMEWDTAAGQAICNAVGLNVTVGNTSDELTYNKENLLNPFFLVSK